MNYAQENGIPLFKFIFYDWLGLNIYLFKLINIEGGGLYNACVAVANAIGDFEDAPFYFLVFLLTALLQFVLDMNEPARQRRNALFWRRLILTTALAVVASGVLVYFMKIWFFMPRPFMALPLQDINIIDQLDKTVYTRTSFPSGHAAFAATLGASLWPYLVSRASKLIAAGFVIWMAWSRVAAGLHFPADVLAGALIGTGVAVLVQYLTRQLIYLKLRGS